MQKRAARFVTGNYNYETGSMTVILGQLKWESLKKRRKNNKLILLYKDLKGKASVPTDDLIPKTRRCRNQHSMAFQTPIANTDVYKGSFFPQMGQSVYHRTPQDTPGHLYICIFITFLLEKCFLTATDD